MPAESDALVCLTTVADSDEADRMAEALVAERLAACVNLLPVRSVYRWKDGVEREAEVLLVVKTTKPGYEQLRARIIELSSYDVPEIVALDPVAVDPTYLAWLRASVTGRPD